MKETKDGIRTGRFSNSPAADSYPLVLDIDDFKVMPQNISFDLCRASFVEIYHAANLLLCNLLTSCRGTFHSTHCLETWLTSCCLLI